MSHRNARTTYQGRLLILERHHAGWPQAHIAKAMGISRRCVSKWIGRFETEGEAGLVDRSSRPRSCPRQTSAQVEISILELRQRERRGRDWVAAELNLAPRTVSRVLARHGAPRLWELDSITGELLRASRKTTIRYERDRPGELVHMDVKKLGRIPDGGGWRAEGQSTQNHRSRANKTRIGYDYVHSLVDDHSRLAYSEVLADEKGITCAGFLERGIAYFAAHGITRIERLITDNAWAYRHSLRAVCAEHAIVQKFIKPHCPWQNGKVERLNRTLQAEWAYRQVFTTNDQRTAALAPWLEHYNTQRRHSSLDGLPPISRL